jgi:hypothetical protein
LESPGFDGIAVGLLNSIAVTIGGVYEVTGSLLVTAVVVGIASALVALVLGLCRGRTRRRSPVATVEPSCWELLKKFCTLDRSRGSTE